ncbi:uncharacterized protein LOC101850485 [Aplysia californica]|uniref:Uncharacterized protein LOC101850485 n=1 Tax=Aplysia californica TaxID=6500 RepID=A0ABM0JS81_APLCA|nr:uncharacterized protein LOC101850485 [Aplysia californica]
MSSSSLLGPVPTVRLYRHYPRFYSLKGHEAAPTAGDPGRRVDLSSSWGVAPSPTNNAPVQGRSVTLHRRGDRGVFWQPELEILDRRLLRRTTKKVEPPRDGIPAFSARCEENDVHLPSLGSSVSLVSRSSHKRKKDVFESVGGATLHDVSRAVFIPCGTGACDTTCAVEREAGVSRTCPGNTGISGTSGAGGVARQLLLQTEGRRRVTPHRSKSVLVVGGVVAARGVVRTHGSTPSGACFLAQCRAPSGVRSADVPRRLGMCKLPRIQHVPTAGGEGEVGRGGGGKGGRGARSEQSCLGQLWLKEGMEDSLCYEEERQDDSLTGEGEDNFLPWNADDEENTKSEPGDVLWSSRGFNDLPASCDDEQPECDCDVSAAEGQTLESGSCTCKENGEHTGGERISAGDIGGLSAGDEKGSSAGDEKGSFAGNAKRLSGGHTWTAERTSKTAPQSGEEGRGRGRGREDESEAIATEEGVGRSVSREADEGEGVGGNVAREADHREESDVGGEERIHVTIPWRQAVLEWKVSSRDLPASAQEGCRVYHVTERPLDERQAPSHQKPKPRGSESVPRDVVQERLTSLPARRSRMLEENRRRLCERSRVGGDVPAVCFNASTVENVLSDDGAHLPLPLANDTVLEGRGAQLFERTDVEERFRTSDLRTVLKRQKWQRLKQPGSCDVFPGGTTYGSRPRATEENSVDVTSFPCVEQHQEIHGPVGETHRPAADENHPATSVIPEDRNHAPCSAGKSEDPQQLGKVLSRLPSTGTLLRPWEAWDQTSAQTQHSALCPAPLLPAYGDTSHVVRSKTVVQKGDGAISQSDQDFPPDDLQQDASSRRDRGSDSGRGSRHDKESVDYPRTVLSDTPNADSTLSEQSKDTHDEICAVKNRNVSEITDQEGTGIDKLNAAAKSRSTEETCAVGIHVEETCAVGIHVDGTSAVDIHVDGTSAVGIHVDGTSAVGIQVDGTSAVGIHVDGTSVVSKHIEETSAVGIHVEKRSGGSIRVGETSAVGIHVEETCAVGIHVEETSKREDSDSDDACSSPLSSWTAAAWGERNDDVGHQNVCAGSRGLEGGDAERNRHLNCFLSTDENFGLGGAHYDYRKEYKTVDPKITAGQTARVPLVPAKVNLLFSGSGSLQHELPDTVGEAVDSKHRINSWKCHRGKKSLTHLACSFQNLARMMFPDGIPPYLTAVSDLNYSFLPRSLKPFDVHLINDSLKLLEQARSGRKKTTSCIELSVEGQGVPCGCRALERGTQLQADVTDDNLTLLPLCESCRRECGLLADRDDSCSQCADFEAPADGGGGDILRCNHVIRGCCEKCSKVYEFLTTMKMNGQNNDQGGHNFWGWESTEL